MNKVSFDESYIMRFGSSSQTKIVNFLILLTFKIKDFEGHYFKLVILQGYTQLILIYKVYFSNKLYRWGQKHITTEEINFLILVTFKIKNFEGHYLKLVVLQGFS